MNCKAIIALASILLITSCASIKRDPIDYASYAGSAIPELKINQGFNNWQRIDDSSLVIWLRPGHAYLLTFRNQCSTMRGASAIGMDSWDGMNARITAGSTNLVVGNMRCRVETIQPIDQAKLDGGG